MNVCYAICYDYVFVIKIVTFENTTTVQHADHKMYQKFEIMIPFNSKKISIRLLNILIIKQCLVL